MESVNNTIENFIETSNKSNEIAQEARVNNLDVQTKEEKKTEILFELTEADRDLAVKLSLVPVSYKDSCFSLEHIKRNLVKQNKKWAGTYKVFHFDDYLEICQGILAAIKVRRVINQSYLIGAPNGLGKGSFVNEAIISCLKQGYKTVPYISLWELAQLRVANEQAIMKPFKKYQVNNATYTDPVEVKNEYFKQPEIVTGRYSFSEYINADYLFTYFTDVISKDIESHTLYQILSLRGAKGLPTIVMISTSLDPYLNDRLLKEVVWDEILAYSDRNNTDIESGTSCDRLYHISCFKRRVSNLETKDEEVDELTGIVKSRR